MTYGFPPATAITFPVAAACASTHCATAAGMASRPLPSNVRV